MELQYDDFEDIKKHLPEGLLMSLDQLINEICKKSITDIRNFKESFGEDIDQAKLNQYVNSEEGKDDSDVKELTIVNDCLSILGDINQNCDIQVKGHIDGLASFNFNLHGADLGKIFPLIWKFFYMEYT